MFELDWPSALIGFGFGVILATLASAFWQWRAVKQVSCLNYDRAK